MAGEDHFLATLGDRAVFVAPGVYEVSLSPREKVRAAFGDQGMRFDRERFETKLVAAQDELARAAHPSRELLRKVHRLEDLVAALQESPAKAALTGTFCSTGTIYDWTLDGGRSSGVVTAKAQVGIGLDFGPFPYYANRYADAYASAYRGRTTCLETTVSASDSRTDGSIGYAAATASVSCSGTACTGWETFSAVRLDGCADGYRSLTRWSGFIC
ncbi:MAG TPA: hypothetical protein DD490_22645 [Acidobacteria bacterium]|nr:hypothetical protein [Acidobacteriota bacterium]